MRQFLQKVCRKKWKMPRNHRRLIGALPFLCAVILPRFALADTAPAWPDTFLARVEALAVVETLNSTLLAARSATFTLDKWCADHKLSNETKIRARLVREAVKPITQKQRRRIQIDDSEPVKYRHVELTCGDRVLSEADNWYVPSRLTAEMNRLLETTTTPFGKAVQDLKPYRRTFEARVLWWPVPEGWETQPMAAPNDAPRSLAIPDSLFEHRAVLYTAEGK